LLEKEPERRPFNARSVQGLIKEHLQEEFGDDLSRLTSEVPPLEEPPAESAVRLRLAAVVLVVAVTLGLLMWLGR
jgi:eukaryotic-like serine/threonine-protein kinase